MFFRQRNTTEFKIKIFIKPFGELQPQRTKRILAKDGKAWRMLWRVPTAKDQVNSSPNFSPKFLKFSPNKSIFSPKVLSLVNVLASSNRKELCEFSPKFLAKGVKFGGCLSELIFQYVG